MRFISKHLLTLNLVYPSASRKTLNNKGCSQDCTRIMLYTYMACPLVYCNVIMVSQVACPYEKKIYLFSGVFSMLRKK